MRLRFCQLTTGKIKAASRLYRRPNFEKGIFVMNTKKQESKDGLDMFFGDKPTELPSVLSGFTPAPDVLIKQYGYVTALIWGKVWRYCQMSDGVCRAAIDKLAEELGMSDNTIMRHLSPLCDNGYLYDSTPERRNKPHIYSDTGKIRIKISVEARVYSDIKSHRQRVTPTTPQSHSESDRESLEESIKKDSKKESVPQIVFDSANKEVDYILKMALSPRAIQDAVSKFFLLTPNWEKNKFNRQWMQWAMENNVTPAQIEFAANLYRSDKRFNWQPPNLKAIQEHWLELSTSVGGKPRDASVGDGEIHV